MIPLLVCYEMGARLGRRKLRIYLLKLRGLFFDARGESLKVFSLLDQRRVRAAGAECSPL